MRYDLFGRKKNQIESLKDRIEELEKQMNGLADYLKIDFGWPEIIKVSPRKKDAPN